MYVHISIDLFGYKFQFNFAVIAAFVLASISLPGILINIYVFYKLFTNSGIFSGFQKLCIIKTIPNFIVCISFFVWATPLCFIHPLYTSIPRNVNAAFGQVAGWGAYIMGPVLQVFMSLNRFYILYFPMRSMKSLKFPITNIAIGIAFVIATIYTVIGLPDQCGFVFDPEIFSWRLEDFPCTAWLADFIFFSVLSLAVTSNSLNFATFLKLICSRVVGVSKNVSNERRNRRIKMYIQSVCQDTLHMIDMVNCTFLYKLNSAFWYQFIFLCVSFLTIHALDGFVILFFHSEIHPKWLRDLINKKKKKKISSECVPKLSVHGSL